VDDECVQEDTQGRTFMKVEGKITAEGYEKAKLIMELDI
jgi:hypothetical protein